MQTSDSKHGTIAYANRHNEMLRTEVVAFVRCVNLVATDLIVVDMTVLFNTGMIYGSLILGF